MARAIGSVDKQRWHLYSYRHGWGSVSDQTGMNKFFRTLNMPYRYYRAGGAHVDWIIRKES